MIKQIQNTYKFAKYLDELIENNIIVDYRVILSTNELVDAYLVVANKDFDSEDIRARLDEYFKSDTDLIVIQDGEQEDFGYINIFKNTNKVDISYGRRRFDALLNPAHKNENPCPIITFYSYKGGMGRSTTLASFAMHLALNENKKVIIIDCDIEAPGFTNFFLTNSGEENQRQGMVEYLMDKTTKQTNANQLERYTWEVDEKYRGSGSIRIMPSGNLSRSSYEDGTNDLDHYLEGLARLNFVSEKYAVKLFNGLFEDLHTAFKPDAILIDSRTGFSDIMGITAFHLSDLIVGFFRSDAQTLPGLAFFINRCAEQKHLEPFIVNAILPTHSRKKLFQNFNDILDALLLPYDEAGLALLRFAIGRNDMLELLGTSEEDDNDLIELIKNKEIKDYKDLFEQLQERLFKLNNPDFPLYQEDNITISPEDNANVVNNITSWEAESLVLTEAPTLEQINKATPQEREHWQYFIKNKILTETKRKFSDIDLYANSDIEQDLNAKRFFYRNCMNDMFNLDKTIILGSKGTGKSYLYNALKSDKITNKLKERAQKSENFKFMRLIDKSNHIFKVEQFAAEYLSPIFCQRFWLVYTWQILTQELAFWEGYTPSNTQIPKIEMKNDFTTYENLKKIISDDTLILAIEADFKNIDEYLIQKQEKEKIKTYITLMYDELDVMVAPELWSKSIWISSLIDFWQIKRYSRIFGKLFLRKDLFKRLTNITNIKDLENSAINIEWQREEMFAYFFKIVFSEGIDNWFWAQMYLYQDYSTVFVKQNRPKYNNYEQLPLTPEALKPLVTTFFGKYVDADKSTRMGESYDWFFNNLKNADNTISIRPFIDLIKGAIQMEFDRYAKELKLPTKPILYPYSYTNKDVRREAVNRHFEDLCRNEIGNTPMEYIFDFIKDSNRYKLITLRKEIFESLLSDVLKTYADKEGMKGQDVEKLKELLITNGIVKKDYHHRTQKGEVYQFAYLYKYTLLLQEPNSKKRKK